MENAEWKKKTTYDTIQESSKISVHQQGDFELNHYVVLQDTQKAESSVKCWETMGGEELSATTKILQGRKGLEGTGDKEYRKCY